MSSATGLKCTVCGQHYEYGTRISRCSNCESVLTVTYDLGNVRLTKKTLTGAGIWKYSELLPIAKKANIITLGEGETYLHRCKNIADKFGLKELYLKNETTNPTGSFLDRGTAVEVSMAKELEYESVCCGSTGNLAASLVAYAARAGLGSKVYLARTGGMDMGKLYQILAYGTDLEIVENHEEAIRLASQESPKSHEVTPYGPYFLEGDKTTAYEICEQLDWTLPNWIIVPMGNGGHLSMIWKGITEFVKIGLLDTNDTKLVGAQAIGCNPIVQAFQKGDSQVIPSTLVSTVAIDIGIKSPPCGHMAIAALKESKGKAISVSDRDILGAVGSLAKLEGVFAEPAGAVTIAALKKLVRNGTIKPDDSVVCIITGMGLKYPEIAKSLVKGKDELEHFLSHVEGRKYSKYTTHLGQTKIRILEILSEGESYGYQIWQELAKKYNIKVKIPSVYQHLSELRSRGLITDPREMETYDRRKRNYYGLTDRGKGTLSQLRKL
jgi:threonine synthase